MTSRWCSWGRSRRHHARGGVRRGIRFLSSRLWRLSAMKQVRTLSLAAALALLTIVAAWISAKPQATSKSPQASSSSETRPREDAATRPRPKREEPPPVPPITFADPDGQDLVLEELSVRSAIHGMLSL